MERELENYTGIYGPVTKWGVPNAHGNPNEYGQPNAFGAMTKWVHETAMENPIDTVPKVYMDIIQYGENRTVLENQINMVHVHIRDRQSPTDAHEHHVRPYLNNPDVAR